MAATQTKNQQRNHDGRDDNQPVLDHIAAIGLVYHKFLVNKTLQSDREQREDGGDEQRTSRGQHETPHHGQFALHNVGKAGDYGVELIMAVKVYLAKVAGQFDVFVCAPVVGVEMESRQMVVLVGGTEGEVLHVNDACEGVQVEALDVGR